MARYKKSLGSRIDWLTLLLYLVLVGIGIAAVYSSEYSSFDEPFFNFDKSHTKQLTWLGISLFVGLIIVLTDSKFFFSVAYLTYVIGILLLILTFAIGPTVKGSNSFIQVGGFSFQPGEIVKVSTALALARFIATPEVNFNLLKNRLIGLVIAFLPCVLIILQNETGLALVYFAFIFAMYREGLPGGILLFGVTAVALMIATLLVKAIPLLIIITALTIIIILLNLRNLRNNKIYYLLIGAAWLVAVLFSQVLVPYALKNVFQSYQVERIYSMFGQDVPTEYLKPGTVQSQDAEYNVRQSKIAIGSGGLTGKGFMNGTHTKYSFVPEQHTDFIFCGIGEQFGFVGSAILVILYVLLLLRILYLAERQRSVFSRVYAYSVASILFFHFAINLSMTMGLAPVIGITLPMLSYGGTSLLSFSILLFILLRLDADREVLIR